MKTFVITYFEEPAYNAIYDLPKIWEVEAESYKEAKVKFEEQAIGYSWSIDEKDKM